jgi:hypothetical protein
MGMVWVTGLYNEDEMCFLCGRAWIFKHCSDEKMKAAYVLLQRDYRPVPTYDKAFVSLTTRRKLR